MTYMNSTHAYVAYCQCGGMVMATVDSEDRKREVAKVIASCVRGGFPVQRITNDEVRQASWCKCKKAAPPPKPNTNVAQMELM